MPPVIESKTFEHTTDHKAKRQESESMQEWVSEYLELLRIQPNMVGNKASA